MQSARSWEVVWENERNWAFCRRLSLPVIVAMRLSRHFVPQLPLLVGKDLQRLLPSRIEKDVPPLRKFPSVAASPILFQILDRLLRCVIKTLARTRLFGGELELVGDLWLQK